MGILPYYVLVAVGLAVFVAILLHNIRLALQLLLTMAKIAAILLVVLLFGSLVGFWELPRPVAVFFFGLRRIWQPIQESILEWLGGRLG